MALPLDHCATNTHSLCRTSLCRCDCHQPPSDWKYSNRLSPQAEERRQRRIRAAKDSDRSAR